MTNIFNYMNKYEEMIHYLESVSNYCDNIYINEIKNEKYRSSNTLFFETYTYTIINLII